MYCRLGAFALGWETLKSCRQMVNKYNAWNKINLKRRYGFMVFMLVCQIT